MKLPAVICRFEVGATCKHFIAYGVDEEPPRLSFDPNISTWQLEQCVRWFGVLSIRDTADQFGFHAVNLLVFLFLLLILQVLLPCMGSVRRVRGVCHVCLYVYV